MTKWLQNYKRSSEDSILGGVCGGLGATTEIPSWLWRILVVLLVMFAGVGIIPYILIWLFAPLAQE